MSDHNYGREDFAEYSQDSEWQTLHNAAYEHPVIESSKSTDPELDRQLDDLYRKTHETSGIYDEGDPSDASIANPDKQESPEIVRVGDDTVPPETSDNGNDTVPPETTDDGDEPSDQIQDELADSEDEYEQLSIEGFDDVDLSDELGSYEEPYVGDPDSTDDITSVDLQEELGTHSEIEGQMSLEDLDGFLETDLTNELASSTDTGEEESFDGEVDLSELGDIVESEGDDYEQLTLDGFDDEELESIGSEESMEDLDSTDSTAGAPEQIDGQMSIDDIAPSVDSTSLGGSDSGDSSIS